MTKRCLLLLLSAHHLHAQQMVGGKIAAQREFSNSQEGREDFAVFLQSAKLPVYLLVDLIEEDFRQETVPHLSGRSRSALLQRKFEQFYRGTPFYQATLLQRQQTGRRDDDMLFSALTNPALVTPWLAVMQAQQIPLAGIYSIPQISAPLVKDHPSKHLLLISWEKFAGLRQTYFSNHRLQISRLTPVHAGLTFQEAVVKEIARIYQYLKSLSLLPPGQTLDVRLLGHSHDLIELQLELPRSEDMRYDFIDLAEVAVQLKIDYRFTDSDAGQIFLHLLAIGPPRANYANAGHTHYYDLWQLRRALDWGSGALLLGCLMWGAVNAMHNAGKAAEAGLLKAQAQRILDEARQITRGLPDTRAPATDMKAGVNIVNKLEQYGATPQAILKPISLVLDKFPQIELNNLGWQINATGPVANDAPVKAHAPASDAIPNTVITLKATLQGFANDYRAALAYLERFRRELSANDYQVTVMSAPLDVSSGGSLADQREARESALEFSLQLVRKPQA